MKTSHYLPLTALLIAFPTLPGFAGQGPQPSICERPCWGARAPKCKLTYMRDLTRAVIHHTASASQYQTSGLEDSKANVRSVQNFHMDSNGWCDVGYHFLVDRWGYIFEARADSMTRLPKGAHDGVNDKSFGFSCLGYFHPPHNNAPVWKLRDAVYAVIAWRMPSVWSAYGGGTYGGRTGVGTLCSHRDASATACPGDSWYYPYITANVNSGEARDHVQSRKNGSPLPAPAERYAFVMGITAPSAVSPGASFQATITMHNSGTLSWTSGGSNPYRLGSQSPQDNTIWGFNRVELPTAPVNPGQSVTFTLNCTAPAADGTYAFEWQMLQEGVQWFGEMARHSIAVGSGTSTEIIIDNPTAAVVGSWSTGTSATDKYATDYRFKGQGSGSSYLQYTPNIESAGSYEVFSWHPQGSNRTVAAPHIVTHSSGATTVNVNQQVNGGRWNSLGIFTFDAGTGGHVRITDGFPDGGQVVLADAIKFVRR